MHWNSNRKAKQISNTSSISYVCTSDLHVDMYQLTAFGIARTMEPNWLHIKAHRKAACVPIRLLHRRNKGARNHLPTHVGWFWVGLVFLYQIILKFYSYLGQGRNQTHCSLQHRQRSEKRKEQKLTAAIHPFTLWSSKARARREQLCSWWPQNQRSAQKGGSEQRLPQTNCTATAASACLP